jgi:hypothetical protein
MEISEAFSHLTYDIVCSVREVDVGKFAPAVVATAKAWPSRPRTLHIRPHAFDTAAEALAAARTQAITWVEHYG